MDTYIIIGTSFLAVPSFIATADSLNFVLNVQCNSNSKENYNF